MASKSNDFRTVHVEAWIDDAGLLRKQTTDKGSVRYEYDNVHAPIP